MQFFSYPMKIALPELHHYLILSLDGPELTEKDGGLGLLLIDGSWRHAEKMLQFVNRSVDLPKRSLPKHWRTAYPRRQEDCNDPLRGLASIEALYAAYRITGRNPNGILDHYYWKDSFLELNSTTAGSISLPIP